MSAPKVILSMAFVVTIEAAASALAPMPPTWVYTPVDGSPNAYVWQGQQHLRDRDDFRRLEGPWPVKGARPRVLAIGDSYTLGLGIAADEAWPAQLSRISGDEVLNFGHLGWQSDKIAALVRDFFEPVASTVTVAGKSVDFAGKHLRFGDLKPDRIVWAVCLNDSLGGDDEILQWHPYLQSHLGIVRLVARRMAPTFEQDLERHQDLPRFVRDVATIARLASDHDVPLTVAVFDNLGMTARVAQAEAAIRAAGVEPMHFELPPGDWTVSPTEHHPNAEAHRKFAQAIMRAL